MALVGDLKDLNIATLVQLNCVEKNTAELTVSARKGPATVFFNKGEIVHATYSGERGEDALYRILSLAEGEFRVTAVTEVPDRTIFTSWESLLLEGMRVIDETERGKARIAESVGEELDDTPEIEGYVLASEKGEVIATNRSDDGEKLAAAAVLLAWKGEGVASRMVLGEMSILALLTEKDMTFFADCGRVLAAIIAKKSTASEQLYGLVDSVRRKLKYCELTQASQGPEIIP